MDVPVGLRYSSDHEWALAEGEQIRVGITDYAQDALGDVVFVELPVVGAEVQAGERFGEVESTKSVSELYAPITGTVVAVNENLTTVPELLNQDPYGEGWVVVIEPAAEATLDTLLDADGYRSLTEG